jgi:hypothetical protein
MAKKYNNIPVDDETLEMVQALCQAYEMGERAQGALVKKVVRAEYRKLETTKLIQPVTEVDVVESTIQA